MVVVVTIMTSRSQRVLARGATDRTKLFFKALAVHDRKASQAETEAEAEAKAKESTGTGQADKSPQEVPTSTAGGFAIDEAGDDEDEEEDDDLEIAAFELLDINDVVKQADKPSVQGAMIPADNFRKLIMLLILVAPVGPQERLSAHALDRVDKGSELDRLRSTAESVLGAFLNVERSPGIKYGHFKRIMPVCFPHLFAGFDGLFEHFLFSKNLDFSKAGPKRRQSEGRPSGDEPEKAEGDGEGEGEGDDKEKNPKHDTIASKLPPPPPSTELIQPLLQDKADILDLNVLSQLSFFIPGSSLFRRLRLLYSGGEAGFSMGSFETKVFNWRAPTILLVRGSRVADVPHTGQSASFASSLPPKRFPDGTRTSGSTENSNDRLTFGIYLDQPWKHTSKECIGGDDSVLFQLEPVHDVFPAAPGANRDYVSFTKPPTNRALLAAGCPHPKSSKAAHHFHGGGRDSAGPPLSLGPVSLLIDGSFEYGVFNHDHASRGAGAFQSSVSRRFDFQDRFEIESLEVWGCGGDSEAKAQAERWAWEAREAEARRKINLGTGDIQADRALLEMAGLVGANRSGGSMA